MPLAFLTYDLFSVAGSSLSYPPNTSNLKTTPVGVVPKFLVAVILPNWNEICYEIKRWKQLLGTVPQLLTTPVAN